MRRELMIELLYKQKIRVILGKVVSCTTKKAGQYFTILKFNKSFARQSREPQSSALVLTSDQTCQSL
jgi:hypothetical protein